MSIELRPIEVDEYPTFHRALSNGFGGHATDEGIALNKKQVEFDRTLAAFDGAQIVGTGGIFSFQLTVPGCIAVPAAGVTMITVLPTHRRRGILTSIMRRQLTDVRERGEPIAMLYASESIIYGRYGYGVATRHADFEITTRYGGFTDPPGAGGSVRLINKEQAEEVLPDTYERFRLQQPGALSRSPEFWEIYLADPEKWRDGASARFYITYTSASGEIQGYAAYRVKDEWTHGSPDNQLLVMQMIAHTPEARFALWRYLLNVDLVSRVIVYNAPHEQPIRWMLSHFRRMRLTDLHDALWLRLVDIPASLATRQYALQDRLVFGVTDAFCPENDGCYVLEGSPEGATCVRTTATPDIRLSVDDLGAVYLGDVSFTTLAGAFRVVEDTPGALHRANLMFESDVVPWCTTDF